MHQHEKIDYVEFPSCDMPATKAFFATVFTWQFKEYAPEYCAFSNAGIEGGFFHAKEPALSSNGSVLLIFYSEALERSRQKVIDAGGTIVQEIFSFPGGRRFHFTEPGGSEFAIWSDK